MWRCSNTELFAYRGFHLWRNPRLHRTRPWEAVVSALSSGNWTRSSGVVRDWTIKWLMTQKICLCWGQLWGLVVTEVSFSLNCSELFLLTTSRIYFPILQWSTQGVEKVSSGRKEMVSRSLLLNRRAQGVSKQTCFFEAKHSEWTGDLRKLHAFKQGIFPAALILHSGLCLSLCFVSYSCTLCVCVQSTESPSGTHLMYSMGARQEELSAAREILFTYSGGESCPTNSFCVSLFKAASWFFINRGCALPLNHSGRIWHFFSFRPSHLHTFIAICYSVCHLTGTTPNYSCAGFCGQLSSSSASCGINASQEQEHQVFDVLGFFFTYFSVHSIKKCNLLAFEKFRFW